MSADIGMVYLVSLVSRCGHMGLGQLGPAVLSLLSSALSSASLLAVLGRLIAPLKTIVQA